jgi:hypothetical protein
MVRDHLANLDGLTVECDQQPLVDARGWVSDGHREHDRGTLTELCFEGAGHVTPHPPPSHFGRGVRVATRERVAVRA